MDTQFNEKKQRGLISSLIGEPTPAKISGLTYSLAPFIAAAVSVLFVLVLIIGGFAAQEGFDQTDWYLYCNYLITPIAFAMLAWGILRWSKTPLREEIRAQKCEPKYFLIAVLMQFGLFSLSELNVLFLEFLSLFGYVSPEIHLPSLDGFGLIGVLLVMAVLPAVFEETIFRGLLLKGLRAFGTVGAILIGGGLFALFHQNPAQTIYQFCCGAAFAFIAVKSKSILPTMLSHFLNNAYIIIMTRLGITQFPMPVYITLLVLEVISLVGAIVWLVLDKKPQAKETEEMEESAVKAERKRFWMFASVGIAFFALSWLFVLISGM